MNTMHDIGKVQEVYVHNNGFEKGNYFSLKFVAKNDECIDVDLNPVELDMTTVALLKAVVKSGRLANISSEVIEILKEGGMSIGQTQHCEHSEGQSA